MGSGLGESKLSFSATFCMYIYMRLDSVFQPSVTSDQTAETDHICTAVHVQFARARVCYSNITLFRLPPGEDTTRFLQVGITPSFTLRSELLKAA